MSKKQTFQYLPMDSVSGISIIHQQDQYSLNQSHSNEMGKMSDHLIENDDSFNNDRYEIKAYNPQNQQLDIQQKKSNGSLQMAQSKKMNENSLQESHDHILGRQIFAATEEVTGFAQQEMFSEHEIKTAFHIIDINQDGSLTFEDISFFLDCIQEEHTAEEVQQMINMVSADQLHVNFQEFKSIGKGILLPFAGFKVPDQKQKNQQVILQNVQDSHLLHIDSPQSLINAEKSDLISMQKFYEERKKKQQNMKTMARQKDLLSNSESIEIILQLRSEEDLAERRAQFKRMSMLNVSEILSNYKTCNGRYITFQQISRLLQISEKEAKALYGTKQVYSKYVLLESILFSSLKPLARLDLMLEHLSNSKTLTFKELFHLMQFMIGHNFKENIRKKLISLFQFYRVPTQNYIEKYTVIQLIAKEKNAFNF